MATYRVKPNGSGWVVQKGNRIISNHRKKSRAKRSVKRKASSGDRVIEQGQNGQILNNRTKR